MWNIYSDDFDITYDLIISYQVYTQVFCEFCGIQKNHTCYPFVCSKITFFDAFDGSI